MGLGLLLVPALGGYWFLTHLNFTRYRAVRDSGYHILFRSALAGSILFAISEVFLFVLRRCFPRLQEEWESLFPVDYSDTAVLSVVLGIALPLVGNRIYSARRAAQKVAREVGDLIELLIAESIEDQKTVEISLKSGKSYIGLALESGIGQYGETDISLIPVASGYRDRNTRELTITTNYAPVIQKAREQSSDIAFKDFQIVIPISEITSARVFLPEVYNLFKENATA